MGRRIMVMSREFFRGMFEAGERHYVVTSGLPADAVLIDISHHYAFMRDGIALKFESAEWSEIPTGSHIPEIDITVKTIKPEKDLVRLPKFREFT